jgi:hypothetical protein
MTDQWPQQTIVGFLSARARSRSFRWTTGERCTGISSDALALYGLRGGPEPTLREYPADRWDLAACERTWQLAPDDVRARMLPVLEKFRQVVAKREATRPPSGT